MKLKFTLNIYIYKSSTKIISFVDSIHTHFMNITSRLFSVNASKKYENNDNYSWIYHCKMGLNRHLFISKLKHILPLHFSLFIEKIFNLLGNWDFWKVFSKWLYKPFPSTHNRPYKIIDVLSSIYNIKNKMIKNKIKLAFCILQIMHLKKIGFLFFFNRNYTKWQKMLEI